MKKVILLLTAALFSAGCITAGSTSSVSSDQQENQEPDDKSVLISGMTVSLDAPFSDLSALLGTPQSSESVNSCVYSGDETIYTYDGIIIQTYPKDGGEYVNSYKITSDQYKVSGKVQVGSSSDDLKNEFPDGTDTGVSYLVDEDTYGRSYSYENGSVTQIELYDIAK